MTIDLETDRRQSWASIAKRGTLAAVHLLNKAMCSGLLTRIFGAPRRPGRDSRLGAAILGPDMLLR